MGIKESTEVDELECDNPACGRIQYEGPYNTIPGFVFSAVEIKGDGRSVREDSIWACRQRCIGPAIKAKLAKAWEPNDG